MLTKFYRFHWATNAVSDENTNQQMTHCKKTNSGVIIVIGAWAAEYSNLVTSQSFFGQHHITAQFLTRKEAGVLLWKTNIC